MATWAADVGGTSIKLAVIDKDTILVRDEIPAQAEKGLNLALERMAETWMELTAKCHLTRDDCTAVGMAFPGVIDPETERIWTTPAGKFDDSKDMDVQEWGKTRIGCAITVCNDANAAIAGEWRYGAARGCANACMMTLGTGVGTGVIVEGRPLRGGHGLAGNAGGHLTINWDGVECLCGNIGCVESEGSSWAVKRQARENPLFSSDRISKEPLIDYEAIFRLAREGDALAKDLLERSLRAWAIGAVNMVNCYDPEVLILGGGVMRSADIIVPFVQEYIRKRAWAQWEVPVVPAKLGNDAGMLGIAYLAANRLGE